MRERIPITILSGYLGAGKTTILNRLLSGNHGRRIAVLVNDFGAINIDADLIETAEDDRISLSNGCVCCSIGDDLGAALDAQTARADPPEHILLEASGVAEPKRIAMHVGFWPGFELDALIVAVDAETVRKRVDDKFVGQLVRSQLKHAEIIALTKTDICGTETSEHVTQFLRDLVPKARIVETPNGDLPVDLAFGTGHSPDLLSGPIEGDTHTHLSTRLWIPDTPLCQNKIAKALEAMPNSIHRVKGFFRDHATNQMTLLQCVGQRYSFKEVPANTRPALVAIGAGSTSDIEMTIDNLKACTRLDDT